MDRIFSSLSFFVLVSFFCEVGEAQEIISDQEESSSIKASFSYLSNMVFMGRADSLAMPYAIPTLGYYHKSGLYLSSSVAYLLQESQQRVDYFSFDLGYEFDLTKKLSGEITANRLIFTDQSVAIRSDIKGDVGASFTYDFDLFEIESNSFLYFATKADFATSLGILKTFELPSKKGKWTIEPKALVNFCTTNYFEGYLQRDANIKRKATSNPASISVTVKNPGFTLMDYEIMLPISFEEEKWGANLSCTYAIPRNTIYTSTSLTTGKKTTTTDSTSQMEKDLRKLFYVQLEFHLKL